MGKLISRNKGYTGKQKIEQVRNIAIVFGILMFIWMPFVNQIYTSDLIAGAYSLSKNPNQTTSFWDCLAAGRPMGFFYYQFICFLGFWGISEMQNQYILQVFSVLIYAICVVILYNIFSVFVVKKETKILLMGGILIGFVNPYITETFVYTAIVFSFGIILAVGAIWEYTRGKYLLSAFFCFLSISSYQSNYVIFFIYTMGYLILSQELNNKKLIKNIIYILGICGGSAVLNILVTKGAVIFSLVEREIKEVQFSNIDNSKTLVEVFISSFNDVVIQAYGMMPKGFLLIAAVGLVLLGIYALKKKFSNCKMWHYVLVCFLLICSPFGIIIVMGNSVWLPQRVMYPIFMSISVLFILSIIFFEKAAKVEKCVLLIFFVTFVSINWYYTSTAVMDCFISNSMDFSYVEMVQTEIEEYEEETGTQINNIAAKKVSNAQYCWNTQILNYKLSTYNHKMVYDVWADVELLNLYLNENYQEIDFSDEKFAELFGVAKWSTFNASEQLVFEGDTLYWAIY